LIDALLHAADVPTSKLGGDNSRDGLNRDLAFTDAGLWKTFGASAA
jgi:adenylylsulfate kinase-like enzyme